MKSLKKWVFLLVAVLSMQLIFTPALAVGEKSEKGNDVSISNGSAEKMTIVTDMYTATVPSDAVIICEGETTQVSEPLMTTTFSNDSAVVEFDYDATLAEMYAHVLENNADLSETQDKEIAEELTKRIQAANELATNDNSSNRMANGDTTIVDLGCISEGKLVDLPSARYVPDSRTSIISEGWSVNPHVDKSTLWSQYVIEWNGLDLYKSPDSGSISFNDEITATVNVGFEGTAGLTKSDALKFGLKVTASGSVTSKISKGFTLNVSAWTKHMLRPYIYYYVDQYQGTYRYYCYNAYEQRYFYVYETRTAENRYNIEKGVRSWVRVNSDHNSSAASPIPPTGWEW